MAGWAGFLVVVMVFTAGCAAPPPRAAPPPPPVPSEEAAPASPPPPAEPAPPVADAPADRVPGFNRSILVASGCRALRGVACFEPAVAADPAGHIYVTPVWADSPARSDDAGATFRPMAVVPLPPAAPEGSSQGDATFQVDRAGRLFFSALLFDPERPLGQAVAGIQVARSEDRGASWLVNTFLSFLADPTTLVLGADRQWLAFGEGDEVYASYWQFLPPVGVWVARSGDGGTHFGGFVRAVPSEARPGGFNAGAPVVLPSGRILLPYVGGLAPSPQAPAAREVRVAASDDKGASWVQVTVHGGPDDAAGSWPAAAVSIEGAVFIAWISATGAVLVAESEDGTTWTPPVQWNEGPAAAAPPAIVAGTTLHLAWYASAGSGYELHHARGASPDTAIRSVVGRFEAANVTTDFTTMALLPDGRAVVAWTDPGRGVFVAVETNPMRFGASS